MLVSRAGDRGDVMVAQLGPQNLCVFPSNETMTSGGKRPVRMRLQLLPQKIVLTLAPYATSRGRGVCSGIVIHPVESRVVQAGLIT